jgi:hypothetical protein
MFFGNDTFCAYKDNSLVNVSPRAAGEDEKAIHRPEDETPMAVSPVDNSDLFVQTNLE